MRFFIALEIPEESKTQFFEIQRKLQRLIPEVKLTYPDKLHLTLAFIGEQPDYFKEDLILMLQKAAAEIHHFEVTPAYIDGFPDIHFPKVIWAGVKGDIDQLIILRERIKDGLETLRLDTDERRFIPHISIGKINDQIEIHLQLEEQLQQLMHDAFDPLIIRSIKLFESIPEGGLHSHNTLATIQLGKP